ncbi:MAG: phytoene/squalene synthase family protein, partial [Thermoplasmatota archaeon]
SLFFPTTVKKDVFTLYGFVRKADNFVDSIPQNKNGFKRFKDAYYQALSGEKTDDIVIDSFIALQRQKGFEQEWVDSFLTSMEMDFTKQKYETLNETLAYIYGSAEVIGLMMAKILRLPSESYPYAQNMGRSMQYINFIRDISEDINLGRCYLPSIEMKKFGLHNLDYSYTMKNSEQFKEFIRYQLTRYCRWQSIAEQGYHFIPKRYLISIKTASEMYHWTAEQIYKNPFIVYEWKVKPLITKILTTSLINFIDPENTTRTKKLLYCNHSLPALQVQQ